MNSYLVTVITSERPFAGTDAKVYIELNGSRGSSGRLQLKDSMTNKNPFEQGSKDLFEITCKDLGTLRYIKIGHDDKGFSSGWHLNQVIIESKLDGRVWVCECNRWLDKKEDDHKIERELIAREQIIAQKKPLKFDPDAIYKKVVKYEPDYRPEEKPLQKKLYYEPDNTIYKITVVTSDVKNAGTDANVYMKIIGKQAETRKIVLEKSKTNRNKFESGRTDEFEISDIDVGKIRKIIIGHDNRGISPNWHLKEVIIEKSGNKFVFPCGKWFDKKSEDGLIERELRPIEEIVDKSDRAHNFIGSKLKN